MISNEATVYAKSMVTKFGIGSTWSCESCGDDNDERFIGRDFWSYLQRL